MDQSLPKHLTQ